MSKIKILLADSHALIKGGVKSILLQNEHIELVGEAEDKIQMLDLVKNKRPDIVLMDIVVPQLACLEVMNEIQFQFPGINFIILSMSLEREMVLKAVRAGVKGYLLKNSEQAELQLAITNVFRGGRYFSSAIANVLAEVIAHPRIEPQCEITVREKEVLSLVANGNSSKQIASMLAISSRTVESHRVNLLKRLNVGNTAELIRKAIQLQLIHH